MKKTFFAAGILMFGMLCAQAAPYYEGPGCDENGENCYFGTPSERVSHWFKKGTVQELGERCDKFIRNIDERKKKITENIPLDLAYKKFTYRWSDEVQPDGRAKIVCSVELHSENAQVKLPGTVEARFFWTCENESSSGLCLHYVKECEDARDEALKGEDVLDARIQFGASLLQGVICEVATVRARVQ